MALLDACSLGNRIAGERLGARRVVRLGYKGRLGPAFSFHFFVYIDHGNAGTLGWRLGQSRL